jgi:hypothetical protein
MGEVFCDIYEEIYNQRQQYAKGSIENKGLKEALNASYGKSNSEYSPLFDPKYTMSITINGQLLICMLAEKFVDEVHNCTILQTNTDGITVKVPRSEEYKIMDICSRWEKLTKLELEYAYYRKMVIRDVNNYIAVNENDSIKRKGAYEYKRELHQNHSMLVVPKAIEAYYVNNMPVEEFIRNHKDIYDFFKRTKLNKLSYLLGVKEETIHLNRVTRYYIAKEGYELIKVMPPLKGKELNREHHIEAGYFCIPLNVMLPLDQIWNNINYDYYIAEANKIITAVSLHQNVEEEDE